MVNKQKTRLVIATVVIILITNPWNTVFSETAETEKYFTVDDISLEVREKPDLTSKVVAVLHYCDKVLFLEDPKIKVMKKYKDGIFPAPIIKIQTNDNIVGYTTKYKLSEYIEVQYSANKSNFKIVGRRWPKYIDPPNVIYNFYKKGRFEEVHEFYDEPDTRRTGQYIYDGCCKIKIVMNNGERINLDVVNVNGKTTLKDRCFIFDPDFK